MSPVVARSALSLIVCALAAVAASISSPAGATTSHRSLEETVAAPLQRSSALLCPRNYRDNSSSGTICAGAGEARQLFITGQVIPANFGQPIGYAQLNGILRAEYRLGPEPDYVFASGYLYAIDHATKIIQRVIPVEVAR
jgi:hypothetical protein